jgi:hypothetical protein
VKVTVPVGVPVPPVGVTVAVKVTGWPILLGFTEDASVVVVAVVAPAALTVWVSAGDVLGEKLPSPL